MEELQHEHHSIWFLYYIPYSSSGIGHICSGDYKKTDSLMLHLRNTGIAINGSKQKRWLINTAHFMHA